MELIHGKDFITHVRPSGIAWRSDGEDSTLMPTVPDPARYSDDQQSDATLAFASPAPDSNRELPACPVRLPILRESLRQMAEGVGAVQRAGKLHRDLKPSNVLVTEQGRVVLDFGVVADLNPGRDITFAGTPIYMSPEQIADQPATEASDWYAVGIMLYEALTGRRPFSGSFVSLIEQKRSADPVFKAMVSRAQIDLYRGDHRSARQHLENGWPNLVRSKSLRIQVVRVEAYHLRARCALIGGMLKAAKQDANRILGERMAWSQPLAEALHGGICAAAGETDRSRAWYERAVRNFEKADMSLFAAAARRRLGEVTGGETGRALVAAADEWMRAQGIKAPERMTRVLTP